MDEQQNILSRLVQVGIVTAIDSNSLRVRVKFPGTEIISDWLYVLPHNWTPAINNRVLCLYLPVFNGDGFVLGGF